MPIVSCDLLLSYPLKKESPGNPMKNPSQIWKVLILLLLIMPLTLTVNAQISLPLLKDYPGANGNFKRIYYQYHFLEMNYQDTDVHTYYGNFYQAYYELENSETSIEHVFNFYKKQADSLGAEIYISDYNDLQFKISGAEIYYARIFANTTSSYYVYMLHPVPYQQKLQLGGDNTFQYSNAVKKRIPEHPIVKAFDNAVIYKTPEYEPLQSKTFELTNSKGKKELKIEGEYWNIDFKINSDKGYRDQTFSPYEIQINYSNEIERLGGTIHQRNERDCIFSIRNNSKTTWIFLETLMPGKYSIEIIDTKNEPMVLKKEEPQKTEETELNDFTIVRDTITVDIETRRVTPKPVLLERAYDEGNISPGRDITDIERNDDDQTADEINPNNGNELTNNNTDDNDEKPLEENTTIIDNNSSGQDNQDEQNNENEEINVNGERTINISQVHSELLSRGFLSLNPVYFSPDAGIDITRSNKGIALLSRLLNSYDNLEVELVCKVNKFSSPDENKEFAQQLLTDYQAALTIEKADTSRITFKPLSGSTGDNRAPEIDLTISIPTNTTSVTPDEEEESLLNNIEVESSISLQEILDKAGLPEITPYPNSMVTSHTEEDEGESVIKVKESGITTEKNIKGYKYEARITVAGAGGGPDMTVNDFALHSYYLNELERIDAVELFNDTKSLYLSVERSNHQSYIIIRYMLPGRYSITIINESE